MAETRKMWRNCRVGGTVAGLVQACGRGVGSLGPMFTRSCPAGRSSSHTPSAGHPQRPPPAHLQVYSHSHLLVQCARSRRCRFRQFRQYQLQQTGSTTAAVRQNSRRRRRKALRAGGALLPERTRISSMSALCVSWTTTRSHRTTAPRFSCEDTAPISPYHRHSAASSDTTTRR